jgi:3D (Asp-Asp-Asp) domain-containing protein
MNTKFVTALTGFFVYGGLLLIPIAANADTLTDLADLLKQASATLQTLQATGGSTTDMLIQPLEATSTPEPTYKTYSVSMTAYNAVPGQTDDSPDYTSIGVWTNPDIIAARSSDLADELPYGTVIDVQPATTTPNCGYKFVSEKIGLRVIGDAMNARMHNKIDILLDEEPILAQEGLWRNPAKALGFCRNVQISVVGHVDIKSIPKTQSALAAAVGLADFDLAFK